MTTEYLGKRLRALRRERGMSQEDVRSIFGFKDRQTVSNIETGSRRLSAEELLTAIEKFGVPLEYFNDPFQLIGEGEFSWRQQNVSDKKLLECEQRARRWIAVYRVLAPQFGYKRSHIRHALDITKQSSFEDAMAAGEQFVKEFGLGEKPASRLIEVMEEKLNILVLMIDASTGVSGAACRLPDLTTVLITRDEVEGRRYFNLAHELFHILTWDAIPPSHIEVSEGSGNSRAEQLANNFASALLMPAATLEAYCNWSKLEKRELILQLNSVADELYVTSTALSGRLVSLGQLEQSEVKSLSKSDLRNNGHKTSRQAQSSLFSKRFLEVVGCAIDAGNISVRRMASVLEVSPEDLNGLFVDHNVDFRIEL